jgi:hypothetical protein
LEVEKHDVPTEIADCGYDSPGVEDISMGEDSGGVPETPHEHNGTKTEVSAPTHGTVEIVTASLGY